MNWRHCAISCLVLALSVGGCRDNAPPPVEKPAPSPPRAPIAMLGTWLHRPSLDARHDTLVLHADSTATGWMKEETDSGTVVLAVARWKVAFMSKDPVVDRTDMPGRYQDGGDVICSMRPDSTCISAPVLCLEPVGRKPFCQGMTFRGDTLWLSNEGRFVHVSDGASGT